MTKICENWSFYLSVISANLIFISYGSTLAWNSPVLTKFQSNDTKINPLGTPITLVELSICTSIFPIGSIIGTLIISKLPDIFGRRKTLIFCAISGSISFCLLFFVKHFWIYVILFGIVSISLSMGTVTVPIYLSEITESHNRGTFCSAVALGKTVGQFYGYFLGSITSFPNFSLLCSVPLIIHLLLSFFTQESPIFFYLKSDKSGAIKTLKKLRRHKKPLEIENEIKEKEKMLEINHERNLFKILFKTRAGKKAFLLSIIMRLLPVVSGIYIIASFLGTILNESGSKLSGDNLASIIGTIKIIASILCIFIIEKLGRKILLLIGSFCCGAALFGLGIYFYYKENQIIFPDYFNLLPIICTFIFVIAYCIGIGGVHYIVISELLPNEVRAAGTSLIFFLCNIILVAESFLYPLICYYLGTYYAMFTFSLFCFIGFVLVFIFLPETKGKSFLDIQNLLIRN